MNDKMTADNHRHCIVCGKPISSSELVCSPECEHKAAKQRRAQRTSTWILLGIVIFLLVIFFLVSSV